MALLIALIQVLMETAVMGAASVLSPGSPSGLSPIDKEFEVLRDMLDEHGLRTTVTNRAREHIEHALETTGAPARDYIHKHVRVPLARMIEAGAVVQGERVFIDWYDSIVVTTEPPVM